jgi:hypothetical protein
MLLLLFLISKIYSMTKLQQVVLYCVARAGFIRDGTQLFSV